MNGSIRPEKEDRYLSDSSAKKPLSAKLNMLPFAKIKWVMLGLMLCIIILLLSFVLFRPTLNAPEPAQSTPSVADATTANSGEEAQSPDYQALTPPSISRAATESQQNTKVGEKRIEIPGEVTDVLANKIAELDDNQQSTAPLLVAQEASHSANTKPSSNELTLSKTLPNTHYTIQISSSSSIKSMLAFVKQHNLTNYQIYETRREQKPWFVLIKGNYPTLAEAKEAIKSLPSELQQAKPWIKSGGLVNKEKTSR